MADRDGGENVTHVLRFPESGRGAAAQLLQEVLREGAGRQVALQGDERHLSGSSLVGGQREEGAEEQRDREPHSTVSEPTDCFRFTLSK